MATGEPLYTIDPFSGETTVTYPDGTTMAATAAEGLRGPFYVNNQAVVNSETGAIVGTLGGQDQVTAQVRSGGRLAVATTVTSSSVNRPTQASFLGQQASVQQTVGGTFSVMDAAGNTYDITVGGETETDYGAFLNHYNHQRAWHLNVKNEWEATSVPGIYRSTAELQAELGPAWRLATARETTDRALRYWLVSHAEGILGQIAANGGIAGMGATTGNYDLAIQLAQIPTLDQLTFTNEYLLPA